MAKKLCVSVYVRTCAQSLSHVHLIAIPRTAAHQATLSMEFSRQKYKSRLSFPTARELSNPEIEPMSFASLALAGRFFTTVPLASPDSEQSGLLSQQMVTTLTRLRSILVLCWNSRAFFTRAHNSPGPICLTATDVPKLYSYLSLTNLCRIFQLPFLQSWRSLPEKPCRTTGMMTVPDAV